MHEAFCNLFCCLLFVCGLFFVLFVLVWYSFNECTLIPEREKQKRHTSMGILSQIYPMQGSDSIIKTKNMFIVAGYKQRES